MKPRRTLLLIALGAMLSIGLVSAATTWTPVTGKQPLTANSGATIVVDGASELNLSQPFINDTAVRVETASGNLTMIGSGDAIATVAASDIEGSTTALTAIDASTSPMTIAPDDKPAFTVGGEIDSVTVQNEIAIDDGGVDFSFSGPDGSTSRVTLSGVPASTTIGAVDADTGDLLDTATSSATGQISFDELANSAHNVELQTSDGGPSVDNDSADPNAESSAYLNQTLSISVDDPDFPADNVTVDFYVDDRRVGSDSLSSAGTATASVTGLSVGLHSWSVVMTDGYDQTTTSETFTFGVDPADPTISALSPTDKLDRQPDEISANITDTDFAKSGDNLSVDIVLDGTTIHSETLSSNGTVSAAIPTEGQLGGAHNYSVVVTDSYDQTTTAAGSYLVPNRLIVHNETQPNDILSGVDVQLTFFGESGGVYQRSTGSNGEINMTGLPVHEPMVVSAEAGGYVSRRVYLSSIYEQEDIYLLPSTSAAAEPVSVLFTLDDRSGQFQPPDETVLFVEKPMNISGETAFHTISSDWFDATGDRPITLDNDQRYRLRLLGPDGEQRTLGAYQAAGDDAATLSVGEVTFSGEPASGTAFQGQLTSIDGTPVIRLFYTDAANATETLSLEVANMSTSTLLRPNTTETISGSGSYVETIPLDESVDGQSFDVRYHASRDGEDDVGGSIRVGDVPEIGPGLGVDPEILSMLGYLSILGTLGMTAISYPRYAGIPTVAVAGALVALGIIAINPLLISGAAVISLIFAVGGEQ